jgi:four helix bundle protein
MGFAFEDLVVYQRALDFSVSIINMIDEVETPRRHYRLIEQLESSCTSITLNIAEGKGRNSKKEFKHFLFIARGSLYETVTMLQIFMRKNWIKTIDYQKFYRESEEIGKMLSGLINSLK